MHIISLGSGSKGNCWYVGIEDKHILIDVGLSMKKINEELLINLGLDLHDIEFIFITHRHIDHVRSLHTIMKKYEHIKFVAPKIVFEEYSQEFKTFVSQKRRIDLTENYVLNGKTFDVSNKRINHDVSTFAYQFTDKTNKETFTFVADNGGNLKNDIKDWIKGSTYIAIESNHDLTQQIFSERDTSLKRRVLGYYGHTHNQEAWNLMQQVVTSNTKAVIYHHLSHECNTEELARNTHEELNRVWGKVRDFQHITFKYARQEEAVVLV